MKVRIISLNFGNMKQEKIDMLIRFGLDLAYCDISTELSKRIDESIERPFWYLRPSHHELMKNWKMVINMWMKSQTPSE